MYLADTISRAFLNETNEQILPDIEFNSITYLSVVKSGWPADTKDKLSKLLTCTFIGLFVMR